MSKIAKAEAKRMAEKVNLKAVVIDKDGGSIPVVFDPIARRISIGQEGISFETLVNFFALAKMGQFIHFEIVNGKLTVERVPQNISSFYIELIKIVERYHDRPADGFKAIVSNLKFAIENGMFLENNIVIEVGKKEDIVEKK